MQPKQKANLVFYDQGVYVPTYFDVIPLPLRDIIPQELFSESIRRFNTFQQACGRVYAGAFLLTTVMLVSIAILSAVVETLWPIIVLAVFSAISFFFPFIYYNVSKNRLLYNENLLYETYDLSFSMNFGSTIYICSGKPNTNLFFTSGYEYNNNVNQDHLMLIESKQCFCFTVYSTELPSELKNRLPEDEYRQFIDGFNSLLVKQRKVTMIFIVVLNLYFIMIPVLCSTVSVSKPILWIIIGFLFLLIIAGFCLSFYHSFKIFQRLMNENLRRFKSYGFIIHRQNLGEDTIFLILDIMGSPESKSVLSLDPSSETDVNPLLSSPPDGTAIMLTSIGLN